MNNTNDSMITIDMIKEQVDILTEPLKCPKCKTMRHFGVLGFESFFCKCDARKLSKTMHAKEQVRLIKEFYDLPKTKSNEKVCTYYGIPVVVTHVD